MTQKPILKNQPQAIAPEPQPGYDRLDDIVLIQLVCRKHLWDGPRMQAWLQKAYKKFKPTFGTVNGEPMLLCPPPWRSTRDMPDDAIVALASAMRSAQNN